MKFSVQLGKHCRHESVSSLVFASKILKEEAEGFFLSVKRRLHQLLLQVLRQILVEMILVEVKSS